MFFSNTSPLPVLLEEEETVQDSTADGSTISTSVAGKNNKQDKICMNERWNNEQILPATHLLFFSEMDQLTRNGPNTSESGSTQSESSVLPNSESRGGMSSTSPHSSGPQVTDSIE